jgi:hypothetical protein
MIPLRSCKKPKLSCRSQSRIRSNGRRSVTVSWGNYELRRSGMIGGASIIRERGETEMIARLIVRMSWGVTLPSHRGTNIVTEVEVAVGTGMSTAPRIAGKDDVVAAEARSVTEIIDKDTTIGEIGSVKRPGPDNMQL